MDLDELGFSDFFRSQAAAPEDADFRPARVVRVVADWCELSTPSEDVRAHVPARVTAERQPVVGDWVLIERSTEDTVIRRVLDRRTQIVRQTAGRRTTAQVIAANVDVVFIVTGLDGDFNPRRIERYLTLVHDSGARPVVLLTKASLCDDVEDKLNAARSVSLGVDVHAIDVIAGIEAEVPRSYLGPGVTAALVGSSGAGKSTLLNHLLGEERMATAEVRGKDDRGRHTTSHRELFWLPTGGAIIDNPGMREIQLWLESGGLDRAFSDVEELAARCRFADCTHAHEPGCAVRSAVERGDLDATRLDSFHRLQAEIDATERRRSPADQRAHERRFAKVVKQAKKLRKHR
jgi:ribosome biogenesis GTPase